MESVLTRCTANDCQRRFIPKDFATEDFLLRLKVVWHKDLMANLLIYLRFYMEKKLPANGDAVTWFQGPETLLKNKNSPE